MAMVLRTKIVYFPNKNMRSFFECKTESQRNLAISQTRITTSPFIIYIRCGSLAIRKISYELNSEPTRQELSLYFSKTASIPCCPPPTEFHFQTEWDPQLFEQISTFYTNIREFDWQLYMGLSKAKSNRWQCVEGRYEVGFLWGVSGTQRITCFYKQTHPRKNILM